MMHALRDSSLTSYRLCQTTSALATVAAGDATAGHIFAWQWTSTSKRALLRRITARWRTIAGPTAAQRVGLEIFRVTGFSAAHTGGTAVATNTMKKDSGDSTSLTGDCRISVTDALSVGSPAPSFTNEMPLAADQAWELNATATVHRGTVFLDVDYRDTNALVISPNEGLIVRNGPVAMGAGMTGVVIVTMDWDEQTPFA